MPRILAIEADPKRKRLLAGLIREFVKSELDIADNAKGAIAIIKERIPDLILTPALLSPADSADLVEHLRQRQDAPYVQLLSIPALDLLDDAREHDRRGLFSPLFGRRQEQGPPRFDRTMVGGLIADGLARAAEARREHEAAIAYRAELAQLMAERRELSLIRPFDGAVARQAGVEHIVVEPTPLHVRTNDDRRTALRRLHEDLPWLASVKLGWGSDVSLVNISTSGVLMETGSKFLPGSTTELHLTGPETNLIVPVRFVRSDVARIDRLGVRYHAAASFDKEIDLSGPRRSASRSRAQALADLLASSLGDPDRRTEPAHASFVRGVRDLVGVQDLQLRTVPPGPVTNRDGLSFDVPDDRFRRTLHVVLDPGRQLRDEDRALLKAAALLTAAALELDAPPKRELTIDGRRLLEECVA
jgi:CheY-like chemotaxis protein